MCGLIWLPRPRTKRPPDAACRSHAVCASVIGLRANATAIDVMRSTRSVLCAASSSGRNGSWLVSADMTPSYPRRSSAAAASAAVSSPPMPLSIFMTAT